MRRWTPGRRGRISAPIAAIDAGKFVDEIIPLKVQQLDGSVVDFSVDEHPRRDTTVEKLAGLKPLHPEIEGFSITAGNSSGTNDAAAAVALVDARLRRRREADEDGDREGLGRSGCRAARLRARRGEGHRQGAAARRAEAVRRGAVGDQRGVRIGADRGVPRIRASTRSW